MIREMRQSEAPDLVELGLKLHKASAYADYPISVPEVFKGLMQMHSSQMAKVFVVERRGRLTGYLGMILHPYWWADPVKGPRFAADRHFFASRMSDVSGLIEAGVEWAFSKPRVVDVTVGVASGLKTEETCQALEAAGMEKLGAFYWTTRSFAESKAKAQMEKQAG